MPLPLVTDLTAYRGDSWVQTFRLLREGQPYDLTGCTAAAWLSDKPGSDTYEVFGVNVADPASGEVTLSLDPATGVPAGKYQYDLEVTSLDGTVTTWVRGKFTVMQDVTNA